MENETEMREAYIWIVIYYSNGGTDSASKGNDSTTLRDPAATFIKLIRGL